MKFRLKIIAIALVMIFALVALLFEVRLKNGVLSWTPQSILLRWSGSNAMIYGAIHVNKKTYNNVNGRPPYFFYVPELNAIIFTYRNKTDYLHITYLNGDFRDEDHDPKTWNGRMGLGEYDDKIHVIDNQTVLLQRHYETPPEGLVLHLIKSPSR